MKIKLTFALLFAGLFFDAKAGCLTRAGEIVQFMDVGATCPLGGSNSFILDGTDRCEIAPTGGYICTELEGTAYAGPYVITGLVVNPPEEPDPDTSGQLLEVQPIQFENMTGGNVGAIVNNTSVELAQAFAKSSANQIQLSRNDKIINDNVINARTALTFLQRSTDSNLVAVLNRLEANRFSEAQSDSAFSLRVSDLNANVLQTTAAIRTAIEPIKPAIDELVVDVEESKNEILVVMA